VEKTSTLCCKKEVIDRITVGSSRQTSAITVAPARMLQWRYAMDNVLFVPPTSF
jgi:16S rRNA A1518/A1519 N6-dimethyltransferase RsmA/KsgA/DIM1 with predicted DNA glycosylase/AP lyase activity